MTKREAQRQTHQENVLLNLGFTSAEAESLRRISMTLRRWYEEECNGTIERDEDGEGRPYRSFPDSGKHRVYAIPDRERGAVKRLEGIIAARNDRAANAPFEPRTVRYYLQTDPRGAVLYIIRPGDVPEGADVSSYYSRGVCVY